MNPLERTLYEVDGWGVGEVWTRGGRLVHHVVPGEDPSLAAEPPNPPRGGSRPPVGTLSAEVRRKGDGFVPALCRRFVRHLAGEPTTYADIDIEPDVATPLGEALLRALRAVPWGEVVTYGELAALAGRPGAARAAGSFCAAGGLGLVVPYHRVVAVGGIGGFGPSGVGFKERLLAAEGVTL